jgi:hypothetical protein
MAFQDFTPSRYPAILVHSCALGAGEIVFDDVHLGDLFSFILGYSRFS